VAGSDHLTPHLAPGRQIIESYGGGGFKVSGVRYAGSVLIFTDATESWPLGAATEVCAAALCAVVRREPRTRILIVGCGRGFVPPPPALQAALSEAGIALEWMNTGAACRTFNVLALEDRDVAAALIAVD
jgi:uncharacterized protein